MPRFRTEQELGRTLPSSYGERVEARIENGFGQPLVALPGVAETIHLLRLPVCVVSSNVPQQIRLKLGLTGLMARFGENLFSTTMARTASRRLICSSMSACCL